MDIQDIFNFQSTKDLDYIMDKIQPEETDASTVKDTDGCYSEDIILQ